MTPGRTVGGDGPHAGQPILTAGAPKGAADVAVVLLHGRGATANGILDLGHELDRPGIALVAPQASRSRWYPYSFMAPLEQNQPHLDSALRAVGDALEVAVDAGVPRERVVALGFSQGACLGTEWAIRNPAKYGGIVALSGGLIGPDGTSWPENGTFDATPAFFACDEEDPHVPAERVRESAATYRDRGAEVTARLEEGIGHTVTDGEVEWVRNLLDTLLADD